MARLPRFVLPGHPQHIIQRGNNRQVIFCAECDYQFYLEKLFDAAKEHKCEKPMGSDSIEVKTNGVRLD